MSKLTIIIYPNYHHKNMEFLEYLKTKFNFVNSIENADIILSGSSKLDYSNYPDKKFILGPHFSVFPNSYIKNLDNKNNNIIYIQPLDWVIDLWKMNLILIIFLHPYHLV